MIENAEIKKVKIFEGGAKLVLKIHTYGDGVLELKIPRNVVDVNVGSIDDQFTVLLDGQPKQVVEKNPNQNDLVCSRHVVIPFSNEASNIEITSFFLNDEPFRNSLGKLYSFDCLVDRSPIVQIKGGVLPDEITCKEDLELVFKPTTKDPKCVKSETATILLQRGWDN